MSPYPRGLSRLNGSRLCFVASAYRAEISPQRGLPADFTGVPDASPESGQRPGRHPLAGCFTKPPAGRGRTPEPTGRRQRRRNLHRVSRAPAERGGLPRCPGRREHSRTQNRRRLLTPPCWPGSTQRHASRQQGSANAQEATKRQFPGLQDHRSRRNGCSKPLARTERASESTPKDRGATTR